MVSEGVTVSRGHISSNTVGWVEGVVAAGWQLERKSPGITIFQEMQASRCAVQSACLQMRWPEWFEAQTKRPIGQFVLWLIGTVATAIETVDTAIETVDTATDGCIEHEFLRIRGQVPCTYCLLSERFA